MSDQTLRQWDKSGRLAAFRTPGNQRYYTEEQLNKVLNKAPRNQNRLTIIYTRVSTRPQKKDLETQREKLEMFCAARGYSVDQKLEDLGSGMNFKRKNFLRLMHLVKEGRVDKIVISYKDRLCRFGCDFLREFCGWFDCKIIIADNDQNSPEEEFIQDMLAILHCFSSKSYSLRRKKSSLKTIISSGVDKLD